MQLGSIKLKSFILAAVLVLGALPALAYQPPNSLGARLGYHHFLGSVSQRGPDNDGVLEDNEVDFAIQTENLNGFAGELEYFRRFGEYFSLGLSAGLYGGEVSFDDEVENFPVRGHWKLLVVPVLITTRFHLPLDPVDLYTGGGLGLYFLHMDFRRKADTSQGTDVIESSGMKTRPGFHLLLGVEWFVQERWSLVLEDHFAFAPAKGEIDSTDVDDLNAGGNVLSLGVRWHF